MNTPSGPAPGSASARSPGGSVDGAAEDDVVGAAVEGAAAEAEGAAEEVAGGLTWVLLQAGAAPIMASAAHAIALLLICTSGVDRLDPGAALDAEQVARIELVAAVDAARHRVGLGRPRTL